MTRSVALVASRESSVAPKLRVFIASPSELANERQRVIEVLKILSIEDTILGGRVQLLPVRWDHPDAPIAFRATGPAQDEVNEQIGKPSACRIVVGILWSTLGVPINSDAYRREGGGHFTGTEWELEDAVRAFESSRRKSPDIYLFKCTRPAQLHKEPGESNRKAGERLDEQEARVKAYLEDWHHRYSSHPYEFETPGEFEKQLSGALRTRIRKLLDDGQLHGSTVGNEPSTEELTAPKWTERSPYRGLSTFQVDDAPIFFGRNRETQQLLDMLADRNVQFLLVAGASGTGKSSLVRAGLLPRLAKGALPGSDIWRVIQFTPAERANDAGRSDPFMSLAHAFKPYLEFVGPDASLAERLKSDRNFVEEKLSKDVGPGAPTQWALFIDQFEELFTRIDRTTRDDFIQCLEFLTSLPCVRLLATMRSEFLHAFTKQTALSRIINDQRSIYTLASPSKTALYDIIVKPGQMAGMEVPVDLAIRMLDDAGAKSEQEVDDAPVVLPLVEFTLDQLYQRQHAGETDGFSIEGYSRIGGIAGAIQRCAEDVIGEIDEEAWERKLSPLFRHLVDVNEAGIATRRRAALSAVCTSPDMETLVRALCDARLLVAREDIVEVAHEALYTALEPLRRWIDKGKDALRDWRNMEFAAAEWDRKGRPDYLTWPHVRKETFEVETAGLGRTPSATEQAFLLSEVTHLLEELENLDTSHRRRTVIGNRLVLLGDPRPGLGFRSDGTPDISRKGYWCPVPPGTVTIEDKGGAFEVEPCYIARHPVTRAQFRAFQGAADGYKCENQPWWENLKHANLKMQPEEGRELPATDVSWYDAIAFCRWLSERLRYEVTLPTEWQWLQAATGGDSSREYPWPGDWDGRRANTKECALSRTTEVGMYPGGASPVGALDMAGNIWEWCLNKHYDTSDKKIDMSDDRRVLHGGSWYDTHGFAACAFGHYALPNSRFDDYGFRLWSSSPIFDR